jgi:hypothetical protein
MVRGRGQQMSIIEREGLIALILELNALGYNYTEIIKEVQKRRNITLSKSALTRFFNKHRQIAKDYGDSSYARAVGDYSIDISDRLRRTIHSIRTSTKDIREAIDKCNIPYNQKSSLKKQIYDIMDEFRETYGTIEHDTMSLMILLREDYESVNKMILEFSNSLCPDCRRKVLNIVTDYSSKRQ